MWYLVILVAFAASTVNGQIATLQCQLLLSQNIGGRTLTTATFDQICNCLRQYPDLQQTNNFYVVVFRNGTQPNFTTVPFNQSGTNDYVVSQRYTFSEFCFLERYLRVMGLDLLNGPLRAIGVIVSNGVVVAVTSPSDIFYLRTATDYRLIDTSIQNRSATMIVITTILPILLALLMALFTAMLFMNCCCCSVFTPTKCQQES